MKNLLYIGNQLKHNKGTVTTLDSFGPLLENEGYHIKYASSFNNILFRLLDMLFTVFKHRKSTNYVLIDTYSTLNFYYAFFISQLCRMLKIKYIPILHGGNLPKRILKNPKLSALIFKNAYQNVAPSEYIKNHFESSGYTNLVTIPNTIQIEKYPFKKRSFNAVKLLWVRSFSEIYNPLLAIKILKSLQDENIKVSLTMVGPEKDGSLERAKKHAKNLNVQVNFTGKLSKENWIKLSEDYNIFINTTNFDNMPVSVMEAMALGLPIISTNVGGVPLLIDNNVNGILVRPDNSNEFVKQIKLLIVQPDMADRLTLNARKKAEEFDWEEVKKKWLDVLK